MRLVKVRIRKGDHAKGEDMLVYPARYDAIEVDRMGQSACNINTAPVSMSGEVGRGGDEEFCVIALPDALAEEYALDPDMAIIDELEADTLMETWRVNNGVPEEIVKDSTRLLVITAKQGAGIALSQEDMDALNPDSSVRGINKTRQPVRDTVKTLNNDLTRLTTEQTSIGLTGTIRVIS